MTCPCCGGKTLVVDSRADDESVRRRRKCVDCRYIFKTIELEDTDIKKEKDND